MDARLCAADDPAFCCCLLNNYVYHEKIIPFPICHSMVVQCLLPCLCAKCAETSGCISHGRDASCQLNSKALTDYMAKSHEEKLRAVKEAEERKNAEIQVCLLSNTRGIVLFVVCLSRYLIDTLRLDA